MATPAGLGLASTSNPLDLPEANAQETSTQVAEEPHHRDALEGEQAPTPEEIMEALERPEERSSPVPSGQPGPLSMFSPIRQSELGRPTTPVQGNSRGAPSPSLSNVNPPPSEIARLTQMVFDLDKQAKRRHALDHEFRSEIQRHEDGMARIADTLQAAMDKLNELSMDVSRVTTRGQWAGFQPPYSQWAYQGPMTPMAPHPSAAHFASSAGPLPTGSVPPPPYGGDYPPTSSPMMAPAPSLSVNPAPAASALGTQTAKAADM